MSHHIATRSARKFGWSVAASAVAAIALSPLVSAPATAAETSGPEHAQTFSLGLTADEVRQAHQDFQAAGIPFDAVEDATGTVNVYHFPEGDFGLRVPPDPGTVSPAIGVGSDADGQYISFNHTDQIAIKNGSVTALLGAIALLNPGVGFAASVFVGWAGTYVNDQGACSGNDELWVYYTDGPTGPAYSHVICRPVSYPGGG